VDPAFREQFRVAKPTVAYEATLASTTVFIGNLRPARVVLLVSDDCFARSPNRGTRLPPPWRSATSMLSKWRDAAATPHWTLTRASDATPPYGDVDDEQQST
jgi:hypothetical protein